MLNHPATTSTLTVKVTDVTRVRVGRVSKSGNPTMRVHTADHGDFLTKTDAAVGYAADNFRPHRSLGQLSAERLVNLTLTPDRRIVNMEDA